MSRIVSHSEITTYLDCQKKWDLIYNKGLKVDNIHLQFGSMGHEVLETRLIPDEGLYPELKEAFGIDSWENYFTTIFNELDETFKNYEVLHKEYRVENEYLKGVIDVVWKNKITGKVLITDYKFSTKKQTNYCLLHQTKKTPKLINLHKQKLIFYIILHPFQNR